MTRRGAFVRTTIAGLLIGALLAVVEVGPTPWSWRGLLGTLAGGAACGIAVAMMLRFAERGRTVLIVAGTAAAGAIGGLVWWVAMRRETHPVTAALVGAGIILFLLGLELLFEKAAAREAASRGP